MKTAVIANPRAAAGRAAKRWGQLERRLGSRFSPLEIRFTERPGHAIELTRQLLRQGFDRIIGVGGDGTYNEIANGFLENDRPVRPEACLGLLPVGTGGDFRRTLEIPTKLDEMIEALASAEPMEIDLGKIQYVAHDGRPAQRYFINVASMGMGGEVCVRAKNIFSRFSGRVAFLYATLLGFLVYRPATISLYLNGSAEARRYRVLNIAIGNGMYHGGGMYVCPGARLDDGRLEVTVIEYLGPLTVLRNQDYLYSGKIYEYPKVRHFQVERLRAEAGETVRIEVDGEGLGMLPVEISVVPKAMRLLVPSPEKLRSASQEPGSFR